MLSDVPEYLFYRSQTQSHFALDQFRGELESGTQFKADHYTIVWINKGCIDLELDFEAISADEQQVFFLTPGQRIRLNHKADFQAWSLEFNREFYCVELHDTEVSCNGMLFNGALPGPVISLDEEEQSSFSLLVKVIVDEFRNRDRIQEEMLRLLLKRFIIKCARIAREQITQKKSIDNAGIDIVREFSAQVELHYKEWHKVKEYADLLNRSPKTLSNFFKQSGQPSPSEIIIRRIILEAKRLLLYTDLSVKEIAFELGFKDSSNFGKFFSKQTGSTPARFKTNLSQDSST